MRGSRRHTLIHISLAHFAFSTPLGMFVTHITRMRMMMMMMDLSDMSTSELDSKVEFPSDITLIHYEIFLISPTSFAWIPILAPLPQQHCILTASYGSHLVFKSSLILSMSKDQILKMSYSICIYLTAA